MCPSCGAPEPGVPDGKGPKQYNAAWLLLAIPILAVFLIVVDRTQPTADERRAQALEEWGRRAQATVAVGCMEAVEAKLQAPRSAKFPFGLGSEVVLAGDTAAALRSYVDAENTFGAMVRTDFVCTGKIENGSWVISTAFLP